MTVVGVVSPGAMGSALGRTWQDSGASVVTTLAGRTARTRGLAAGLTVVDSVRDVVRAADLVVSVVPSGKAAGVAAAIVAECRHLRVHPLLADLNAIEPAIAIGIGNLAASAGCGFVDGSISGPPPHLSAVTCINLSGPSADFVARLGGAGVRYRIAGPDIGLASAVKMCTSSIYKGLSGLLLQALRTADHFGVTAEVLDDLDTYFSAIVPDLATSLALAGSKSDRYPDELRHIARTQAEAGLGPDLFDAVARVFAAVSASALGGRTPEQAALIADLDLVLRELGTAAARPGR